MFRSYLERGLVAGALGGLAFGSFVAFVGNPLVGYVEEVGHAADGHHDHAHGAEGVVSEAVTNLVSVGGGVLWGLLFGAVVFGALYYFFEPAIPGGDVTKRYVLAAAGFVTVSGAPWLVLPPQPAGLKAVLSTETRILLYGGMVVAGALVCVLAGYAYHWLTARGTARPVAAVASLAPFALLAIPVALAPTAAVAGEVPTELAGAYRGFVVFGQAMLWFVVATAHAYLGTPTGADPEADAEYTVEESYPAD